MAARNQMAKLLSHEGLNPNVNQKIADVMDSLDFISFLGMVEDDFEIKIPEGKDFQTFADIADWIEDFED